MGLFLFAAYGIKVFNVSISHDTEAIMAVPDSLYGSWLFQGRFGLNCIEKVTGNVFVQSICCVCHDVCDDDYQRNSMGISVLLAG